MAYATLIMKNPHTGWTKEAPVGLSWTMFFFSFFVPLYRKDYLTAIGLLALSAATAGFASILFAFFYNKNYIKQLIDKGYQVAHSSIPVEQLAARLKMPLPVLEG